MSRQFNRSIYMRCQNALFESNGKGKSTSSLYVRIGTLERNVTHIKPERLIYVGSAMRDR